MVMVGVVSLNAHINPQFNIVEKINPCTLEVPKLINHLKFLDSLYFHVAAVEGCLSHGLRRRALGLFRSSSTTALMHKVAKGYPPAAIISKLILEAEASEGVKYVSLEI